MNVPDFRKLIDAPADILGKPLLLLHWTGPTKRVTLVGKDEVATAIVNGWTRYKIEENPERN